MEAEERTNGTTTQVTENRSLLVLYGTETGKSQEIAQEIGRAAEGLLFQAQVEEMNDVSLKELAQYSLAIFVTSTTGQGDIPANATTFWKSILRKKLPPNCLSHIRFTTFGLGDSSYQKFNWAARKLHKRLLQLGAAEFCPPGEGDERHDNGIDSIYLPWFETLKARISAEFPLPLGIYPIPDDVLLPPKYPIELAEMDFLSDQERWEANREKHAAITHVDNPKSQKEEGDDEAIRRSDTSGEAFRSELLWYKSNTDNGRRNPDKDNILKDHPEKYDLLSTGNEEKLHRVEDLPPPKLISFPQSYEAKLLSNKRVTPGTHWQDVRALQIRVNRTSWSNDSLPALMPGDTLTIYPKNFPADVEALIDLMGWTTEAGRRILWHYSKFVVDSDLMHKPGGLRCPRNLYPPKNATVRDLLIHNIDFNAIPNRTFLKDLRRHTTDEREKERLLELTSEANSQEFYDYTSRPRRTILEVLRDFPGVKIPVDYALEVFPLIRGRAFSIANHPSSHESLDAKFHDVEILAAMVEYKTIIRKPRQGLCSRYLKSLKPGTQLSVGLTRNPHPPPHGKNHITRPLIAIGTGTGIAPIRSLIHERQLYENPGQTLLFFGARNREIDYYYGKEWETFSKLSVFAAFSRDPIVEADRAFLDPYSQTKWDAIKPECNNVSAAEPMTAENTPWVQSVDYDRGKMYIQHQIRRYAEAICAMLDRSAVAPIIVICGNSGRMPISVRRALEDALVIGGKAKNNEDAKRFLHVVGIWMETW
ncbi:NADPH-dependent FMN/FAD containing oxidoreductase [Diaporthe helianthi]|uniref:NADPH-dependent diflavin oxidoreductase 1 n=1 Tax=Diaporthe helianthi TaxID=158607 RepID=A0A2P5HKM7_DIAHE|nr:NADPH-dependent FMN/FAD containing oxidoreductase [Diaporthe helianthi]